MLTIDQMRQEKRRTGYSYQQIAEKSGVPLGTVQKVFSGATKSPRHDTLAALEKVFVQSENTGAGNTYYHMEKSRPVYVKESSAAYAQDQSETSADKKYPRQGSYTLKDYLALPEDQRVELIDGVFYEMLAPYPVHQDICFMLGYYFQNFIEANHGSCRVLPSPVDVQLDRDDKTVLEPDLCICCDMEKIKGPRIYGAPDMLIEILSGSTKKKDLTLKNWKYSNAGVKEYWAVDPAKLKVIVYDYQHDNEVTVYGFHDKVPVGIYDGRLVIDFEKIYTRIQGMYGVGTDRQQARNGDQYDYSYSN